MPVPLNIPEFSAIENHLHDSVAVEEKWLNQIELLEVESNRINIEIQTTRILLIAEQDKIKRLRDSIARDEECAAEKSVVDREGIPAS